MKKEDFNEKIGKTHTSFLLDTLYRKGSVTAQTPEDCYEELFQIINQNTKEIKSRILKLKTYKRDHRLYYDSDEIHELLNSLEH
jgi:hypothetical protein